MIDEDALLAAIHTAPEDDTPRLAYADWLDEHAGEVPCQTCSVYHYRAACPKCRNTLQNATPQGSPHMLRCASCKTLFPCCPTCRGSGSVSDGRAERAEFIRVQVALARLPTRPSGNCRCDGGGTVCGTCRDERDWDAEVGPLKEGERALLSAHWESWHGLPAEAGWACLNLTGEPSEERLRHLRGFRGEGNWMAFQRGFTAQVRVPLASLMGGECGRCNGRGGWATGPHAEDCRWCDGTGRTPGLSAQLGAVVGLTAVRIVDVEPHGFDSVGVSLWNDAGPRHPTSAVSESARVPAPIYAELQRQATGYTVDRACYYPTRTAALDALSAAALCFCRQEASRIETTAAHKRIH